MVLACLSEVHDPDLIPQVLYMHQAYSASVPDVAANYVRALLCKNKRQIGFVQRPERQIVLSNGFTATELILARCASDRFTAFEEICDGLTTQKERQRVGWNLSKMLKRGHLERIGKHRFYSFRLLVD